MHDIDRLHLAQQIGDDRAIMRLGEEITALTLYVAQTLICLWLLYPPFALALYGRQDWVAMMLTALAVDAVLLVAANIWVRHYRIAPVEWAWRSLVEGRRLRFRN